MTPPATSDAAAAWRAHVTAELGKWARKGVVTSANHHLVVKLYNQVFAEAAQAIGHPARAPYTKAVACFGCAARSAAGRQQLAELAALLEALKQFANA